MIQLYICGVLTMVVASIRVTWKVAGVHGICMARHVAGDEERKDRGAQSAHAACAGEGSGFLGQT